MSEQMPLAVGYVLVERGCHNGCADVARATTDKDGQSNLAKLVGVLEILQTASVPERFGRRRHSGECSSTLMTYCSK